jgi:hypothetical protein
VSSWTEGQKEKWALRKTLIYMLDHPGLTLERAGIKFANFWGLERVVIAGWQHKVYQPPRLFTILGTFLIPLFYMTTMLLACLGIFLSPPDDRRAHGFLLLLIGFIAGMHTLTFGHERYHLPLIPILLVYAAAAVIQKSWWNFREGMQKLSAPITGCMLLLFIWGWEVLVVDADRIKALFTSLFG